MTDPDGLPIHRPETNPFVVGAANLMGLGGLGYWLIGQRRKALIAWGVVGIGGILSCGLLIPLAFITAYDAYLLGQRLQLGQRLAETENAIPFLGRIFR